MQWKELTASQFAAAVRDIGVCVVPMGVFERHGDHLPLGTDVMIADRVARLAAEREPAVVFPPFYFGQIYEARCFPGTVTISPRLLLELLQGVLDEIGRNGFNKIVLYSAHGGNSHFLPFVAQCALWEEKDYSLYIPGRRMSEEAQEAWQGMRDTDYGGHAGELETSLLLAIESELARMDQISEETGKPRGRLEHLPPTYTGIWWYGDYPEHYAGDATAASEEKGRFLLDGMTEFLADYIAAVKADEVVPNLMDEFYGRVDRLDEGF